jgi:hypothetical protein
MCYHERYIKAETANKFKFTTDNYVYTLNDDNKPVLNRDFSSGFLSPLQKKNVPERNIYCDTESETVYFKSGKQIPYEEYKKEQEQEMINKTTTNTLHDESKIISIQAYFKPNHKSKGRLKMYIINSKKNDYGKNSITVKFNNENVSCELVYIENDSQELLFRTFYSDVFEFSIKHGKDSSRKHQNTYCWFHNLKFDVLNMGILNFQKDHSLNLDLQCYNFSKPTFIKYKLNDDKKFLTFIDSFNFYSHSLKKIGEMIGISKQSEKVDFTTTGNEHQTVNRKFIEYSVMDVVILCNAMERLMSEVKKYGSLKMGCAGTAFNIWLTSFYAQDYTKKFIDTNTKQIVKEITVIDGKATEKVYKGFNHDIKYKEVTYQHNMIWLHKNLELTYLERRAYFGGMTDIVNATGYYKHVNCIDVNSMYPSIMMRDLAGSYIESYKNVTLHEYKKLSKKFFTLCKIKVTDNNRIVPAKIEFKTCFINCKDYETSLWQPEVELLIEKAEKIELLEVHCYKRYPYMKKFSEYFMNKKVKCSEIDDEVGKTFAKLMNNSCYGKTGERYKHTLINEITNKDELLNMICMDTDFDDTQEEINNSLKTTINMKSFGGKTVQEIETPYDAPTSYPAIAGVITSYARVELWKTVYKLGKENCIYTDTDSIYYNNETVEQSKFNIIDTENQFSHDKININKNLVTKDCIWDLEKIDIQMVLHTLKDYIMLDQKDVLLKRKLKGVNLKQSTEIEQGIYYFNHWLGINESIKNNSLHCQVKKPVIKMLNRVYNKGYTEFIKDIPVIYFFGEKGIKKKTEIVKEMLIKPFLIDNSKDLM